MSHFFSSKEAMVEIICEVTDSLRSTSVRDRVEDNLTNMIDGIDNKTELEIILSSIERNERIISNNEFLIEQIIKCCRVFCEVYTWIVNPSIIKAIFEKEIHDDVKLAELILKFSSIDFLVDIPIFQQEMRLTFEINFGLTTSRELSAFVRAHISIDQSILVVGFDKGFVSSLIKLLGYSVRACDLDYSESDPTEFIYFSQVEEYKDDIYDKSGEDVLFISSRLLGYSSLEKINRFKGKLICFILPKKKCEILIESLSHWKVVQDETVMYWSNIHRTTPIHILLFNKK